MSANEKASFAISIDSRGAVKGARQVEKSLDGIEKETMQTEQAMSGLKGTALKLLAAFGGFVAVRQAIQVIANFEDTMGALMGVTQATDIEMAKLENTARSLGATTRFTAAQAGEGLLFLSRAGFSVAESTKAVAATLDLATAAQMELGRASDITANIIRQFGLEAGEAARVADVLVNSANKANTTVEMLAQGMSFAGPVAKSLGISVETTAAALGVLSDSGIKSTRAGMGLRQVMLRLVDPTAKAKKEFRTMGITMDEINPERVGFTAAIRRLNEAQLTVAESARIFGVRQAAAGLVLAEGVNKMDKLSLSNDKAAGSSRRNAAILEKTLIGRYKELISTLDEVKLKLGESGFSGALKSSLKFITAVTRELFGIKSGADQASIAVRATAFAVKGLTVAVGVFIALSWPLVLLGIHKAVIKLIPTLKTMATMIWAANKALLAMALSVAKVLLPAIAAIGVAFIAFEFTRWVVGMKEVQLVSNDVVSGIARLWEWLKNKFRITWAAISDIIITFMVNPIITAFHNLKNEVLDVIHDMAVKIKKTTRALGLDDLSEQLAKVVGATTRTKVSAPTIESDFRVNLIQIKRDYEAAIKIIDDAHMKVKTKLKKELAARPTQGFVAFMQADLLKIVNAMGLFKGESTEAEKILKEMEESLAQMRKDAEGIKPVGVDPLLVVRKGIDDTDKEMKKAVITGEDFANTLASGFASATREMKNFGQAIAGIIVQLQNMMMEKAFQQIFNQLFSAAVTPGATTAEGLFDNPDIIPFSSPAQMAGIELDPFSNPAPVGPVKPGGRGGDTYFQMYSPDARGIQNMLIKDDKVTKQMATNARAGYSISNPEVI